MKKTMLFIGLLLFMGCGIANNTKGDVKSSQSTDGPISIFSTPDLYNLTTTWANEFCRLNPSVQIKIINVTESSIAKNLSRNNNLGFISSGYYSALDDKSVWKVAVGRDVIVPVINSKNPLSDAIDQQGISSEKLAGIFKDSKMRNWGMLLQNIKKGQNLPIHYYMIDDGSVNSKVANFLDIKQNSMDGIKVKNETELIAAIQKDPYAIGFCKMIDVVNFSNQSIVKGLKLMPIDRNNNGRLDYFEKIYDNLNSLSRAIWIGKYPRLLSSNIYTVSSGKPSNDVEIAFLKWVFTDGQQYLISSGYSDLAFSERQTRLDQLSDAVIVVGNSNDRFSAQAMILLIIIGIVVFSFIVNGVIWFGRQKKGIMPDVLSASASSFNENSVNIPRGLYFDKSHTWAFMEKDGIVKVGIDDFLQHTTGPLTRTIMKNPGDKIKKGEQIVTLVQNGKHLNICAPISGTIKNINKSLVKDPSMINSSPYAEGWVYMIEPSNWLFEIQFLKMAGMYKEWIINEYARLKDFLAVWANAKTVGDAQVVFQSGGELKDNVLQNFGPELWEDFQRNFINTSELS